MRTPSADQTNVLEWMKHTYTSIDDDEITRTAYRSMKNRLDMEHRMKVRTAAFSWRSGVHGAGAAELAVVIPFATHTAGVLWFCARARASVLKNNTKTKTIS